MPFTPYHFGAGAALHSAIPSRISFLAFCGANVLTDLEPLYYLLIRQAPVHRFFHTFLGALVVAALTVAVGMVLLAAARRVKLPNPLKWQDLRLPAIAAGALLGTVTHVILDALSHGDVRPFAPFSAANPLQGLVSYDQVATFCAILGAVGFVVVGARWLRRRAGDR